PAPGRQPEPAGHRLDDRADAVRPDLRLVDPPRSLPPAGPGDLGRRRAAAGGVPDQPRRPQAACGRTASRIGCSPALNTPEIPDDLRAGATKDLKDHMRAANLLIPTLALLAACSDPASKSMAQAN